MDWSDSIAVGSEGFLEEIKAKLGYSASHRNPTCGQDIWALRETAQRYGVDLGLKNVPLGAIAGHIGE